MEDLEERIGEVKAIKRFGEDELGLRFGEQIFSEIKLDGQPFFYSVYASHTDRIESAFYRRITRLPSRLGKFLSRHPLLKEIPPLTAKLPLLSQKIKLPYEEYDTDKDAAEERKRELQEKGLDVLLFAGEGYGGTDCPIVRSTLEAEPARKAYIVLHEGFHLHSWRHMKDGGVEIPIELEEPLGNYVGMQGATEYFREHNPELVDDGRQQYEEWSLIAEFVVRYHERLSECYSKKGKEREEILREAREEAARLKDECTIPWIRKRLSSDINNAFFLRYITYSKHHSLVNETLEGVSLKDYLANPDKINAFLLERITKGTQEGSPL